MAGFAATVYGIVQGVGFRYYVRRMAKGLNVTGYVRNMPDGVAVQVHAEGEQAGLDEMVNLLQIGPRSARVDKVDLEWLQYKNAFSGFEIRF